MKKFTTWTITLLALAALPSFAADDNTTARERRQQAERRGDKADIDKLIRDVNALDNKAAANRAGLAAVSKETAVPLPKIQAEARQHPRLGIGGLFVAHELSTKTQKPVEHYFKQHAEGKKWSELAKESGQDLDMIERKLARIEDAMRGGADDRSRVRERGDRLDRDDRGERRGARSALERRIDAVNALDDTPAVKHAGLMALSKETAVPLPTVQEAEKNHPNAGLGDLFVAQELSTKTQKPVDELLKMHRDGKTWAEIAASHNQDINSVEQKLARVEESMRSAVK